MNPPPQESARERALRYCAAVTRGSGSNFYLAFLPLPKERRDGIFCVYAYCRRLDDIVDEPGPGTDPRRELDRWRERIERLLAGTLDESEDPLAVGLAWTHERFGLRGEDLHAVIDGMEMDLAGARYPDAAALALYCRRVAGHVGCLCLPVFGCPDGSARDFAMALGHAFQLTNILRDVVRDAEEGRIYLPLEDLARFGVGEEEVLACRPTPRLRALLRHEGDEALRLFQEAASLLPASERSTLFSASIMGAIYRRLLERLREIDFDIWSGRPRVPRREKLLLALGVLLRDRVLHL